MVPCSAAAAATIRARFARLCLLCCHSIYSYYYFPTATLSSSSSADAVVVFVYICICVFLNVSSSTQPRFSSRPNVIVVVSRRRRRSRFVYFFPNGVVFSSSFPRCIPWCSSVFFLSSSLSVFARHTHTRTHRLKG